MVRIIDVLSALSTDALGTSVPRDASGGRSQHRFPLAILLLCLVCLLALQGCAGLAVSASRSPVDRQPPAAARIDVGEGAVR